MKLAEVVSIILSPILWIPVIFVAIFLKVTLPEDQKIILLSVLFFLECICPLLFIFFKLEEKKISSWDLPKLREREPILLVIFIFYALALLISWRFGDLLLFKLNLVFVANLFFLAVITEFWKISFHASINTIGAMVMSYLLSNQLIWLYLTIPIVFWSRLILKRHTLWQLLAGTGLSGLLTWLILKI